MSDNWVVQNLENALETWNEKLAEIWQLLTQSPEEFKDGAIWNVIVGINDALKAFWLTCDVTLVDFKLEFGKTSDGTIVLADEISPDTCRFWDSVTHEKLDKDRFRRNMGGEEDAYKEIMKRLLGE